MTSEPNGSETAAGIVLAGGRSSRMGEPKAWLEWHGSTLLRRAAGIVGRAVQGPVVVVRAPGQDLPALPDRVEVAEDAHEGRGPMMGLAAGLAALAGRADVAYLASTDAPFLHPAFVAAVLRAAKRSGVDVAIPHAGGHRHPLAAAYATSLLPTLERLIGQDRLKPPDLLEAVRVAWLDEAALGADLGLLAADPELSSLRNLNTPVEYEAARAEPPPAVTVERLGAPRGSEPRGAVPVRAATLGQAAAAAGIALDLRIDATLNGDRIPADPELPLAGGDAVALISGS